MGKLKQPLFRTWLFTYIIFIIISLAFIYQIYNINIKEITNQINKVNNTYISQIQSALDTNLSSIDSVISTQILNQDLLDFLNYETEISDVDPFTLYEINNDLRLYDSSIGFIDTLYVYAYQTNIIIGDKTVYKPDTQSILIEEKLHLSKKSFDAITGQIHFSKIFKLSDLTGNNADSKRLIFLHSIPVNMKNPTGLIIAELNYDSLDIVDYEYGASTQESFYIVDKDNYIVYSNGDLSLIKEIDFEQLSIDKTNTLERDDGVYYAYVSKSEVNNWKYVHVVDEGKYLIESKDIRSRSVTTVLVFSLLSLVLAYIVTYYLHKPLNRLMKRLRISKSAGSNNEFDIIEQFIDENEKDRQLMANEIHKQDRILKNLILTKWLLNSYDSVDEVEEQFERFNVELNANYYQVISLRINTFAKLQQSDSHVETFELVKFIIKNVFGELFTSYVNHEILEIDDLIIGVFAYTSVQDENRETIKTLFSQGHEIVLTNYGIELTMSISDLHEGLQGAGVAFKEAQESLIYNAILGELDIVEYSDLFSPAKKFEYSLEQEYKLINLLKIGEEVEAVTLFENLMKANTRESLVSIESLKCLLFNVMGSVMKAVQTERQQKEVERLEPIKTLMAMNNLDEMQRCVIEVMSELCKVVLEEKEEQDKEKLEDKIEQFINNNYSDLDLNVAKVAEAFAMSTPYISKVYKQGKGMTILNYIHKIRIDVAKELLTSTSKTVNTIAQEVGFTYSHVFIRMFKKETGLTPGQYRDKY